MLNALKFVVWTGLAIWFGTFLATAEFQGQTPLQHLERSWKKHASTASLDVDRLTSTVKGVIGKERHEAPAERHSDTDKQDIERLISSGRR
jgi:hypothetical protein